MHLKKRTIQTHFLAVFRSEKLVWFFMTGVLSSLTDVSLLYLFTSVLGIWYITSAAASYCSGIIISYTLNKYLTFHDTSREYFAQFSVFAAISVVGLGLNLGVMWVMVEYLSVFYLIGKVCGIFIGFIWNYSGQSTITFRGTLFR
jgi:putative flippase GtrA